MMYLLQKTGKFITALGIKDYTFLIDRDFKLNAPCNLVYYNVKS